MQDLPQLSPKLLRNNVKKKRPKSLKPTPLPAAIDQRPFSR
jgi:hypothetical protein